MNNLLSLASIVLLALTSGLFAGTEVSAAPAKAKAKPAVPAVPQPSPLEDGTPASQTVLAALAKADYRFAPEVKSAFLAFRKERALAEIAKAGQSLPKEFLDWVDGDPVVAATIYGIADNAARRLVLLRSLELDLGKEEVRQKHLQLALGITDAQAHLVDPATLANPAQGISLQERGLFKLEIKRHPCEKVDTHPKDRPLDINDHIINFLEDNPVITEKKVVKEENGQKTETVEKQSRPLHAYEVYSNPEQVKKFNAYMTERGFKMELDCGNGKIIPSHWGGGRDIVKAYKLFRTAYEAKGRLPKMHDPRPTPAELAAYLIRNDNYRFPEGVKRGWPKFPLNASWPVLDYLVHGGESLREREFVWQQFCKTGSVVGYGSYIGPIAQYPDLVKARKLQPFDFTYDTYPMRLKDGGVCGTCSNIGRFSHIALGIPAGQAGQPGHSCFISVGGYMSKGFSLSIGQSIAGPDVTYVSGRGRYIDELIKFYPINYGLLSYLDARTALELNGILPAATTRNSRLALQESACDINPYYLPAANAVLTNQLNPADLVKFEQKLEKTLAGVEKPGCPKQGHYNQAVRNVFDSRLAKLPPPADKADLDFVLVFLNDRADAIWLKYQLTASSLPALKEKLAADLKSSIAGQRTPPGCDRLSQRLALAGNAIKDEKERQAWAKELLEIIGSKTMYTAGEGKKAKEHIDPCVVTLRTLAGNSPDARAEFEKDLKAAVEGVRTPAICDLFVKRLEAIIKEIKNPKERQAWANTLLEIIDGHETYAPPNAPTHFTLDPLAKAIYTLGGDLTETKAKFAADLQASVAGERTAESTSLLSQRLAAIAAGIRDAKQTKAWADSLLPIIAGHETYSMPLPKNQGTKQVEDPCATLIYRQLGKKVPAMPPPEK
jgi:hypothetical protein